MMLLRSVSVYGTRSPQELLKASGLTQVREPSAHQQNLCSIFIILKKIGIYYL